jgi:hypothetical protein
VFEDGWFLDDPAIDVALIAGCELMGADTPSDPL